MDVGYSRQRKQGYKAPRGYKRIETTQQETASSFYDQVYLILLILVGYNILGRLVHLLVTL